MKALREKQEKLGQVNKDLESVNSRIKNVHNKFDIQLEKIERKRSKHKEEVE